MWPPNHPTRPAGASREGVGTDDLVPCNVGADRSKLSTHDASTKSSGSQGALRLGSEGCWRVARSWRGPGQGRQGLPASPAGHQAHRLLTVRTKWGSRRGPWCRGLQLVGRFGVAARRLPGLLLARGEPGRLVKQCPDAVESDAGSGMQPAKAAHPGVARRQDVLQEPTVVNVGMMDQGPAPGGQDPEHAEVLGELTDAGEAGATGGL